MSLPEDLSRRITAAEVDAFKSIGGEERMLDFIDRIREYERERISKRLKAEFGSPDSFSADQDPKREAYTQQGYSLGYADGLVHGKLEGGVEVGERALSVLSSRSVHKLTGKTTAGFLAICACGAAVDDYKEHLFELVYDEVYGAGDSEDGEEIYGVIADRGEVVNLSSVDASAGEAEAVEVEEVEAQIAVEEAAESEEEA
jgi:hypothetical protein